MAEDTEHTEHPNIPRRIVEELVDVLVYAPVGLASTVFEELPALVEKGRNRLTVARTIGQFAVVMGRQRIGQAMSDRAKRPANEANDGAAEHAGGKDKTTAGHGTSSPAPAHAGDEDGPDDFDGADDQHRKARDDAPGTGSDPSGLAIPGYDALAASQVVQRLAGLSSDELDAVRRYEDATRGRRTILGRISQLSGTRGEPEQE